MYRTIVPNVISGQKLHTVTKDDSVLEAAKTMAEFKIAATMVLEDNKLIGIVTERDMTTRVIAGGKDPAGTKVSDVMTANPDTLKPDDKAIDALTMMRERKYRHLPVVDGDNVVGMVSIRDLYAVVTDSLERDLEDREKFIYGESYGAG